MQGAEPHCPDLHLSRLASHQRSDKTRCSFFLHLATRQYFPSTPCCYIPNAWRSRHAEQTTQQARQLGNSTRWSRALTSPAKSAKRSSSPTAIRDQVAKAVTMAQILLDLVYSLGNCLNCFPGSPSLKINGRSFKILRLLGEVRQELPSLVPLASQLTKNNNHRAASPTST